MKLPDWVPEVRRPWNPSLHATWEAMNHTERQVSYLTDWAVVLLVIVATGMLAGCDDRKPEPAPPGYWEARFCAMPRYHHLEQCKARRTAP